jgi:hypothetical protein
MPPVTQAFGGKYRLNMLKLLKETHRDKNAIEAIEALENPSVFSGLEELNSSDLILQLFFVPSFEPICSWSVYQSGDRTYNLRRVRWDFTKDQKARIGGASLFGADAILPKQELDSKLDILSELKFPALKAPEKISIADGTDYGVKRSTFRHSVELWWTHCPSGWEELEKWYSSVLKLFDKNLPMSTEVGGRDATYRFATD